MADRLMLASATMATFLLSTGSAAQPLTDPTRPPLELMRVAVAGAADTPAPRPRLESILLSSARKGAIINGQYVALGEPYGKATLVKITATEVTLQNDQGPEVLQLYPPMEKPSAVPGAEGKPEKVLTRP